MLWCVVMSQQYANGEHRWSLDRRRQRLSVSRGQHLRPDQHQWSELIVAMALMSLMAQWWLTDGSLRAQWWLFSVLLCSVSHSFSFSDGIEFWHSLQNRYYLKYFSSHFGRKSLIIIIISMISIIHNNISVLFIRIHLLSPSPPFPPFPTV